MYVTKFKKIKIKNKDKIKYRKGERERK